ncbi:MAG: AAA family ATPase [Natronomonas sp.]
MVEAFAVASGKGGTGKTTCTLALGMALADDYDVTVVDADTGMANLLFHAGLADAETTLQDVLMGGAEIEAATYDRFGMSVVPCGTSLDSFEAADPDRLRDVVADLAAATDVILLDSPATLSSKRAVLPIVLADRVVVVLNPTVPAVSNGLKVQEYALSYGSEIAGTVFNRVQGDVSEILDTAGQHFRGPHLAAVPESDAARAARSAGVPLLEHAPDSAAAEAYREAAAGLDPRSGDSEDVAERFRTAVIPDPP